MTLTDLPVEQLDCIWIFPKEDHDWTRIGTYRSWATDEEIRVNHHGSVDFGRPWVSAWGRPERLQQWADRHLQDFSTGTSSTFEALRIEACRPWVGVEITDQVTPLDIGLPDAVAENKGCYPGQEVIEKIAALGSPAKRLVLGSLKEATPIPLAAELGLYSLNPDSPIEVGKITSVSGQNFLAIVRKTHAKEGAEFRVSVSGPVAQVVQVAPYLKEDSPSSLGSS